MTALFILGAVLLTGCGSGFAGTRQTIAELEPGATVVMDGLSISRNSVTEAEASVVDWVRRQGLNKKLYE